MHGYRSIVCNVSHKPSACGFPYHVIAVVVYGQVFGGGIANVLEGMIQAPVVEVHASIEVVLPVRHFVVGLAFNESDYRLATFPMPLLLLELPKVSGVGGIVYPSLEKEGVNAHPLPRRAVELPHKPLGLVITLPSMRLPSAHRP